MLDAVCREIGKLYGRLGTLNMPSQALIEAENIVEDVVRSSEIEGVLLHKDEVRSSVTRNLGIDTLLNNEKTPSRMVDAVVNVMMTAMAHYQQAIDKQVLCGWHSGLFETGFSGGIPITVGQYRQCAEQIVSGAFGHEKIHYVAPAPERVPEEMESSILHPPTRKLFARLLPIYGLSVFTPLRMAMVVSVGSWRRYAWQEATIAVLAIIV